MTPETKATAKKPAFEYGKPIAVAKQHYIGKCEGFSKKQIEAVAAKMPASFGSIKGHEGPKGICLYSSSGVFSPRTVKEMVEKLKSSCTKWAGEGSEKACEKLIENLETAIPPEQKPIKPYDPHSIDNFKPWKWPFWAQVLGAIITGTGFAIGTDLVSRATTGKGILHNIKQIGKKNNNDDNENDNDDDLPKPPRIGGNQQEVIDLSGYSWDNMPSIDSLSKMSTITPELSYEIFALRVLKVLGPDAGYDFIMQRGHDFESLNLLSGAAFTQTVKEYAMWDGVVESDAVTRTTAPAAERFLNGAQAYLAQPDVQADIRSVTVAKTPSGISIPGGHVVVSMNGSLYFMPVKGIAMPRIGLRMNVNIRVLRPVLKLR